MPSRRHPKQKEEYTYLCLRVDSYEARLDTGINPNAYAPQLAWDLDDRDPLYKFVAHLTIMATSISPEGRAGEQYELTLYTNDAPSSRLTATLKDVQTRDKNGSPQYRQYRGKQVPVYAPPKGIGYLEKVRGEARWTVWLCIQRRFANDILMLLGHQRTLFVAIQEYKEGRQRRVRSMSLQTDDPTAEESS